MFDCSIGTLRVILRKGHVGQNFYFIYSGSVFVNVEDTNAQGEKFVKTEVVLHKGDSFGVSNMIGMMITVMMMIDWGFLLLPGAGSAAKHHKISLNQL